ncbi:hypothetical protein MmiAt1_14400 [Methanimicrococcus sp. At1]|uniref:HTH cro/C1-type domain-containing protein n=2 Tax=Methanimicrococcus hacksteinii TaxID=3028293 RepID=A0ABU3VSG3_9EURY|nr:hypothetical protein [Methanimicrococcus sp. At1]
MSSFSNKKSYIFDIYCSICDTTFIEIFRKECENMTKNLKIKAARAAKDMTQKDLAEAVGVTRQTMNAIEAGDYNPSLNLCIAICKALDKTLDELFWEE